MKNLKYFIPIFTFASFVSCTKEESVATADDFMPIGEVIEMSQTFTVGDGTRAFPTTQLRLTASMNTSTEQVLSYKVFRIEDDIACDLGISDEELDAMLVEYLGEDFTDLQTFDAAKAGAEKSSILGDCLNDCNEKYTDANGDKIKGRGNCKFGCWGKAVITTIEKVGPTIVAIIVALA